MSLTLNTDGVSLFHSSRCSLWPVWLVVNEQNRGITYLKQLSVAISYLVGIFVDTDFPEKI